jgi:hypothetical protein
MESMVRESGARRALTAFMVSVAVLVLPSAASATGPVYDLARDCVNSAPTTPYTSTYLGGPLYETLGDATTVDAAARLRDQLEAADIFGTWQRLFASSGRSVLPRGPGGGSPYEIYVVPDADIGGLGYRGVQTRYCSSTRSTAVVIPVREVDRPDGLATAAHELFHAFQSGAAGGAIWAGWWNEATAEWGNKLLFDQPLSPDNRDDAFLRRPEIPLDRRTDTQPDRIHQYGAFRFVERLSRVLTPRAFADVLVDTFEEIGHPRSVANPGSVPDQTEILRRVLDDHGRDLDTELGRFWAAHLDATSDNGPAATVTPMPVDVGESSENFRVRPLAAKLLSFPLGSRVKKVRVQIDRVRANEHLWIRAGGLAERDSYDQTFCVNRGTGATLPPWLSDFAVAYTNGTGGPESLRVRATGLTTRRGCGSECSEGTQMRGPSSCPVPPAANCDTVRRGDFRTPPPLVVPWVVLDVGCEFTDGGLTDTINGFGGRLNCANLTHQTVSLSSNGDPARDRIAAGIHGRFVSFTHQFSSGSSTTTVTAEISFTYDTATGTVRAINESTSFPTCDSGPVEFTAHWESP